MGLKEKFSLNYLSSIPRGEREEKTTFQTEINEAIVTYGLPLLKKLSLAANQQMKIHDLAKAIGVSPDFKFEEFMSVINKLTDLQMIEILERDVTGNHLLHLTSKGQAASQILYPS